MGQRGQSWRWPLGCNSAPTVRGQSGDRSRRPSVLAEQAHVPGLRGLAVRQVDSDFSGQTQKRTCGGYNLNQFRCYYEATEAKTVRCQPQGRHVDRQTGRGANPRTCGWVVLTRAPRPFSRKDGLCNRWCWESWTSSCERMNLDPPQHYINNELKMDQTPKSKT